MARFVSNYRTLFILGAVGLVVAAVALGVYEFWWLGGQKDSVRKNAAQLAAAIVVNDPAAAPNRGDDYVVGINAYFGPVQSAKVVEVAHKSVANSGANSAGDSQYWAAELLLHTEKGPALIEIQYDTTSPLHPQREEIELMYELSPDRIPGDLLSAADRKAVLAAYAARGGRPADDIKLNGAFLRPGSTTAPPGIEDTPIPHANDDFARQQVRAQRKLHCIQHANGDVKKLERCAKLP